MVQYMLPAGGSQRRLANLALGRGCDSKAGCAKAAAGANAAGRSGFADVGVATFGDQKLDEEGNLYPEEPMTFDSYAQRPTKKGRFRYTFIVPGSTAAMLTVFQE